MAEVCSVRGLTVTYGPVAAVRDLDLSVAPGEVLALLGPSGSGKSTLLHTLAGFLGPAAGEVWLGERRVATPRRWDPPERREVAFVFQDYGLWPHLSAVDTVAYPVRRRGRPRDEARGEALEILGRLHISHLARRRPAELSGGEQQRVGLARALARRASLFLFDEPTAHLDAAVRAAFLDELADRRREAGTAALYATHDAEEALGLADRVALLTAGQVVQVGTPEEVYAEPVNEHVARLTGPVSVLAAPGATNGLLVRPDWASLDGDRPATVEQVAFHGPHTDYRLVTDSGVLLVRQPGGPLHRPGDRVAWRLRRSFPLPSASPPQ